MYITKSESKQPNFLASAKFQNFTYQVDDTGVIANADGKKIVEAGTVYKVDEEAIGLLFRDVDVTHGSQAAAIMVEGWVLEDRLPSEISTEDKAAMKNIKFKKESV